jgi:hypothetical protein
MRLHGTQRWRRLARAQLREHPLCVMCLQNGSIIAATVADHVEPHRDDPTKFWTGELQSLCKFHHDSSKQSLEIKGYRDDIGIDGWPLDPRHPVNSGRKA